MRRPAHGYSAVSPISSFLVALYSETRNRKQPGRQSTTESGLITEATWHRLVFFRIVSRERSICTDFTSRKPSHTPTRAFLRREPGAIRRFASSWVCIKVVFQDNPPRSPLRRQR